MWITFKVFIEYVTMLFLFYVLGVISPKACGSTCRSGSLFLKFSSLEFFPRGSLNVSVRRVLLGYPQTNRNAQWCLNSRGDHTWVLLFTHILQVKTLRHREAN